jgi:hypothetical protein
LRDKIDPNDQIEKKLTKKRIEDKIKRNQNNEGQILKKWIVSNMRDAIEKKWFKTKQIKTINNQYNKDQEER